MTGWLLKVLSKSPKNLPKVDTEEGEIMVNLIINTIHLEPIHRDKITHQPRAPPDTPLGHTHPLLHFKSTIILWPQAQVCVFN